ncbi:MAG TPA: HAD-IIA family hydrolase [Actinomycetes bacterium]|nr:HAD-IIA family hydrolase [Actinomycetes bacterium]
MVLTGSARPLAERYDAALLDLDGVVYRSEALIPHAAAAIDAARAAGMRVAYITNNAARTPDEVAAQLRTLGINAEPADIVTSAQAAARLVAARVPAGSAVLVVGGAGIVAALGERGLRPVRSLDDNPVAVVQGYAPDVDWRQLAEGSYAVNAGLLWVATNTDLTIPTARGIAPGNGTLVRAIQAATGQQPLVAGKPELPLHREAVARTGGQDPLVVGDRLDTDIEGAVKAGSPSLLVLTGVTRPAALVAAPPEQRPSYLAADLRGLVATHPDITNDRDGYRCAGWHARARDGELEIDGSGDPIDGLRALCAASWTAATTSAPAASTALSRLGL